ncbi:phage integrase SAM-like domain-containing protein, partial [Lactobacillus intestinalis]
MASIYKRGKTWTVRFSKRVKEWDPDKQAMVSVLKQKSKGGFKTKAEANAYGIKMEAESLSGVDVTKNPTLTDYFKKWYETYKKPGASDATKTKYKFHILIIKKYWGQTRIKDISRSQYQAFINKLAEKYAPVTVQKLNGNLKACMSSAVSDGILTRNFISNVKSHGNEA